ncbi:MAG: tRNA (N6-isopentenyl adenosine(37)-C2)-methylthiotransferase MiaB [Proteobacteria bacterium]|jgi:tRNA-2-methylthio-N6-dimethylallyladenosine synthase|nr:tRNA (N6-isopentenyl adenosine(37)-C2)-methylthiotransferase MiaB [Alphaproteobacteria bacterium]NCC02869.1 tRNA (N6-isopentenyl adenosine(37)-C2)-methylthiotransferase MiaB [Pseudomonadota bacterium]
MTSLNKQKLFIKTWGCQMNVYDSARMADVLAPLGYEQTDDQRQADLIILNTCHIREKASEKLFSELGRLHDVQVDRVKEEGVNVMIAVGGCVAQAVGEEIARRAPYVGLIFGPQTYHQLPEMLARAAREGKVVLNTDFPVEPKFDFLPSAQGQRGSSAFLSVQEGCDRFCSYCVVPYTRGAEYSRPMADIVNDARELLRGGVKEITLLGQNVNAYHDEGSGKKLADVIEALASMPELLRLRYTTSHPLDMDEALIAAHRDVEKLMPFLHLPVQSGSDAILDAMNRKHTVGDYRHVVELLRSVQPKLALSSDFIVGFPGETDKDFEATMQIVRDITYVQAFSFIYSRRPGTPAAAMKNQIDEKVKKERLAELQKLLRDQQIAFNNQAVGQVMSVLLETPHPEKGHIFGRSPYMQAVRVKGCDPSQVGQEVQVQITCAFANSLAGDAVK